MYHYVHVHVRFCVETNGSGYIQTYRMWTMYAVRCTYWRCSWAHPPRRRVHIVERNAKMKLIFIITNLLFLLFCLLFLLLSFLLIHLFFPFRLCSAFFPQCEPMIFPFLRFISRVFASFQWIVGGGLLSLHNFKYVPYILCKNCNRWKSTKHLTCSIWCKIE